MKKKPPVASIILTVISLVPPLVFQLTDRTSVLTPTGLIGYALSPVFNLCAIALGVLSIIFCQKSVKKNGEYTSAYVLLVINSASIIINLILAVLNKLFHM